MQKTQRRSRTSSWQFWWLDNSRPQGPKRQLRISKQSSICSRGTGSSYSMDPGVPVQKQDFTRNTKELANVLGAREETKKSFYTDNSLEFGKACERAVRRVKGGTSAVLLQSGLNESWWADSLECYTYLRNVTDLLCDGKTPYERRFGQPFKGPIIPFGSLGWVSPFNCEGSVTHPSIWKESFTWIVPRICSLRGRTLEGWRTDRRPWGVRNDGRIGNLLEKRLNAKEVIFHQKGEFTFPIADGRIKTPGEDQALRTSTLIRHRPVQGESNNWLSWRFRRVSSTTSRLISGCRWSDKWFVVHVRKLHIPPSRWTQSHTLLAERRIIPYSTEVHWRIQNYSHEFGMSSRRGERTHRWSLECRWVKRFVRSLDRFHTIYSIGRKAPDGYMWSGERLTRKQLTSRPDHLWPELWKSMGKHAKLKEKQKVVQWKAPSWKRTKIARELFHRPGGQGIQRNHKELA